MHKQIPIEKACKCGLSFIVSVPWLDLVINHWNHFQCENCKWIFATIFSCSVLWCPLVCPVSILYKMFCILAFTFSDCLCLFPVYCVCMLKIFGNTIINFVEWDRKKKFVFSFFFFCILRHGQWLDDMCAYVQFVFEYFMASFYSERRQILFTELYWPEYISVHWVKLWQH